MWHQAFCAHPSSMLWLTKRIQGNTYPFSFFVLFRKCWELNQAQLRPCYAATLPRWSYPNHLRWQGQKRLISGISRTHVRRPHAKQTDRLTVFLLLRMGLTQQYGKHNSWYINCLHSLICKHSVTSYLAAKVHYTRQTPNCKTLQYKLFTETNLNASVS